MMPRRVDTPDRPPTQSEIDYGCALQCPDPRHDARRGQCIVAALLLVVASVVAVLAWVVTR